MVPVPAPLSRDDARKALRDLVTRGLGIGWLPESARPLLGSAIVQRRLGSGETPDAALVDVVREAVGGLQNPAHRRLLEAVLGLSERSAGLSARERRELAGKTLVAGRAVTWGTIRQHHEPKALDALTDALCALDREATWVSSASPKGEMINAAPAPSDAGDDAAAPGPRVPAVVRGFTGRTVELAALQQLLAAPSEDLIACAIVGLGGIGKTQLAAKLAQLKAREQTVVYWVRASDGGDADLAALAELLDRRTKTLRPRHRARAAVDLIAAEAKPWLLVLDNVTSPSQLAEICPRSGNGRVVVTSRHHGLQEFAPTLTLDVLDEDDAAAYLMHRANRSDESPARELARELGCLPLALSHAGAYCATGTSFEEYLDLFRALPSQAMFDSSAQASYEKAVATTWGISVDRAIAEAPLAGSLLEAAACLDPQAVPKYLLESLIDRRNAMERKELHDGINALVRLSLATADGETVSLHRLLQKTVRDAALARKDETGFETALTLLFDAFPQDGMRPEHWPRCAELLPHVVALSEAVDAGGSGSERLISLLNRTCQYLIAAGSGQAGVELASRNADRAAVTLGREHPHTLTARYLRANALLSVRKVEAAIADFEAVASDQARVFGASADETVATRKSLASAYRKAGKTGKAISAYEAVLQELERSGGPAEQTLRVRHNLATALRETGRYPDALTVFERLFADCRLVHGDDHPDTLVAARQLASVQRQLQEPAKAVAVLAPLLDAHARILGAEHPATLAARQELAGALREAGHPDEGLQMLGAVYAISRRAHGSAAPETLDVGRELLAVYRALGRGNEATAVLAHQ